MADIEVINMIISANTQQAETKLKSVATGLDNVDKAGKRAGGAVTKTTTDFTKFSRVVQDLPYGINAISNNLSELIPAAGGAGLAFSAVISAITFASVGLQYWVRNSKEAKEATEAMAKAQGQLAGEITSINALIKVAKDHNESLETRTAAIKELQKEYPGYLGNLNLENINSQETANAVDKLTAALARKARITVLNKQLVEAEERLYTEENKTLSEHANFLDAFILKTAKNGVFLYRAGAEASQNRKDNIMKERLERDKLIEQIDKLTATQTREKDKPLLDPTTAKQGGETIASILERLRKDLSFLTAKELNEGISQATQKISAIESAIKGLINLGLDPENNIIKNLFDVAAGLDYPRAHAAAVKFIKDFGKTLKDEAEKAPYEPVNILDKVITLDEINFKNKVNEMRQVLAGTKFDPVAGTDQNVIENWEKYQALIKETGDLVGQYLAPAFDAVFNAIAKGENVFESLSGVIKGVIVKLAAAAAQAAILAIIINLVTGGTGSLLSGFSSIFKGLTGIKLAGAATGGIVTKPTLLLAGEAGPERIVPLNREMSANNNAIAGNVEFVISGEVIRGILRRANNSAYNTY